MIKKQRREFNIVGLCVIIALLFLCVFNVTYSYFSAVASINGNMSFYNLDIKFGYRGINGAYNNVLETTLTVSPNASIIARGDEFELKVGDVAVDYLYFNISGNSCDSYVRFMLDAYKVNEGVVDTSVNYGQYFQINSDIVMHTRQVVTNSDATNAVYYMNNVLSTTGSTRVRFCDDITLLTTAPVGMLNGEIKLTITFKAVQAANEAYKSVFNDGWGYLDSWS